MAIDPTTQTMEAVFTVLNGDATLIGLINGIFYDRAPQDTDYPYVTISSPDGVDDDTKETYGQQYVYNIHTWTQSQDSFEGRDILANVYRLLHNQDLTIAGSPQITHVDTRFERAFSFPDPDEQVDHGIAQYRIWVDTL